jgi:hypothetical protein
MKESKINEDGFYIIEIRDFSVDTIKLFLGYMENQINYSLVIWDVGSDIICEYLIFCNKYFISNPKFEVNFEWDLQVLINNINYFFQVSCKNYDINTDILLFSLLFKCNYIKDILDILVKQNLDNIVRFAFTRITIVIAKIDQFIKIIDNGLYDKYGFPYNVHLYDSTIKYLADKYNFSTFIKNFNSGFYKNII